LIYVIIDKDDDVNVFMVPDRLSGLETLKEPNPRRKWNFVHVNVALDELKKVKRQRVRIGKGRSCF
jgi:hypothetical protein